MPNSMGTDRKVFVREASKARLGRAGSGVSPLTVAVIICCWAGQMMNQTLNHMIVPNNAPMLIHSPALDPNKPASPVKPLPSRKYFQRIINKPGQKGEHGSPAEPPQRTWHDLRNNLFADICFKRTLKVGVDQIEIVQQPDPGDTGQ